MGAQKITSTAAPHTSFRSLQGQACRAAQPPEYGDDSALALVLSKLRAFSDNCVVTGLLASAPTSASTQATGATGATALNVNISAGIVAVNGQLKEFTAAVDTSLWDTTVYTGDDSGAGTTTLTNGKSAIVTLVAASSSATRGSGTITLVQVHGATATTGAQVAATDAEIQTKVGASLPWVKIAEVTVNRTGDTTVTQSQNNILRPALGISTDSTFWGTVSA